jgi:hypothetical protein
MNVFLKLPSEYKEYEISEIQKIVIMTQYGGFRCPLPVVTHIYIYINIGEGKELLLEHFSLGESLQVHEFVAEFQYLTEQTIPIELIDDYFNLL